MTRETLDRPRAGRHRAANAQSRRLLFIETDSWASKTQRREILRHSGDSGRAWPVLIARVAGQIGLDQMEYAVEMDWRIKFQMERLVG